jgi:DNA-binding beta-propeller fold protein YncE
MHTPLRAALSLVFVAVAQLSFGQTGPRAFVLDQDARTVTAIDVGAGRAAQTATIEGSPAWIRRTPDGQRLVVLDRGQGRDAGDNGFRAKTQSVATILDARTLAVQGRVEIGWGLEPTVMFDKSGTQMSVICSGFVSRNPKEALPRELVTIDLAAQKVTGRLTLPRRANAFFSTPDGTLAAILSYREKGSAPQPAEMRLIDLAKAVELAVIPFEGDPRNPVLSPDGKFVYLLDRGDPSGNPDRNVNGRVHVVSLSARKVDSVADAGSRPRGFVLDERGQQMLLLSEAPPERGARGDRPGQLRVIRGATVGAPINVEPNPVSLHATDDGKKIFLVSGSSVTGLSVPDLKPVSTLKAGVSGVPIAFTPDGRRLFANHMQNLWTYDLDRGVELDKITTGRTGARLFAALDATVSTEASKAAGRREAQEKGRSYYQYTEYSVRDPDERMAVRPDSKAVYVLNQQTSDVTVVDSESGKVLEKVGTDGFGVYFLPSASVAIVADSVAVHVIDMTTHKKVDDLITSQGASECVFASANVSPDARFAIIRGSGCLATVNGSSGKATATVLRFKRVADVELDWSAPR